MNHSLRITAAVWGAILGISSMSHGFFEILQGNTPTPSTFIYAIGEGQRFWERGNEPAFTLLPTFLLAGIAAMAVGLIIVIWTAGFMHTRHSASIFVLLCILSVLVGGGIAQVLLFPIIWLIAVGIHKPLTWWTARLPEGTRQTLAGLWRGALSASALLLLLTLVIATVGIVPGISDPEHIEWVMGATLLIALVLYLVSGITGLARDIQLSIAPKAA